MIPIIAFGMVISARHSLIYWFVYLMVCVLPCLQVLICNVLYVNASFTFNLVRS